MYVWHWLMKIEKSYIFNLMTFYLIVFNCSRQELSHLLLFYSNEHICGYKNNDFVAIMEKGADEKKITSQFIKNYLRLAAFCNTSIKLYAN